LTSISNTITKSVNGNMKLKKENITPKPSYELQMVLNETEKIKNGELKVKKFNNIDSLMKDLTL